MPELTVVVPAYRERDNVLPLLAALEQALVGCDWEAIFVVDDALDGTEQVLRERAQQDPRVRCLHRVGRRGLASACVEGMLASSAPYLAVIDADLQHDESLIPQMLDAILQGDADIVVASRYMEGGSAGELAPARVRISRVASVLRQSLATWVAMTSNFFLNNVFTYGDQRLRGRRMWRGLISFYLACGVGAVINLAVADWLYLISVSYWVAGLAGAVLAAVWNFF